MLGEGTWLPRNLSYPKHQSSNSTRLSAWMQTLNPKPQTLNPQNRHKTGLEVTLWHVVPRKVTILQGSSFDSSRASRLLVLKQRGSEFRCNYEGLRGACKRCFSGFTRLFPHKASEGSGHVHYEAWLCKLSMKSYTTFVGICLRLCSIHQCRHQGRACSDWA